jgi:hypothetical protein
MLNQPLFAALDVSLETTTICIMSFDGTITKEAVVATEPDSIAICLGDDLTRLVRVALFEAAHVILTRVAAWSKLKAWAMNVAKRRGAKRAKVALARKLGVVLHRMWVDESEFRFGNPAQA